MATIDVLFAKLAKQDSLAATAANALLDQARKNSSKFVSCISTLEGYLHSANLDLRATTAAILGKIGTDDSLAAILEAFELETPDVLEAECHCSPGLSAEPLYYWYLAGISDAHNNRAAELLAYVAAGREFKDPIRACAMQQLYYCMSGTDGFRIPADCLAAVHAFADHSDSSVAEKAIQLLGEVTDDADEADAQPSSSFRPPREPTKSEKSIEQVAIDFRTVDMGLFLSEGLKNRFAAVRARDFEDMIARMFKDGGYQVEQTPYSCDFGADLVISKPGVKAAIQVKRYAPTNKVGVQDVNQLIGGQKYYDCRSAIVITTSGFTKSATEIAKRALVELWNWDKLSAFLIKQYNR